MCSILAPITLLTLCGCVTHDWVAKSVSGRVVDAEPGRPVAGVSHGLYMAALVAARHNPILRDFYLRLRAAGKPAKLALTATMRKLLIVLNSALKPDLNYA